MLDQPQIIQTEPLQTAVIRFAIPRAEIQQVMGAAIGEVLATVARQGIGPAGPVFSHHFRIDPEVFDFEVGVPVHTPVSATGRVIASQLPAAIVARAIYHGPYEGLSQAWGEFEQWIVAQGLQAAANLWEFYKISPESSPNPAEWQTEFNRPLSR